MRTGDDFTRYALRIAGPARVDINAAHVHFTATASEKIADEWQDGLMEAIRELATTPKRQVAPESRFFRQTIRQLIYRRRSSAPAYRILFVVADASDDESLDGPTVTIIHVRHGSRRPMTAAEVRALRNDL